MCSEWTPVTVLPVKNSNVPICSCILYIENTAIKCHMSQGDRLRSVPPFADSAE